MHSNPFRAPARKNSVQPFARRGLTTRDYIFRCIALAIVWSGLVIPSVTSELFLPADIYDLALSGMVLVCGGVLTLVIWCGPELVRRL